MKDDRRDSWVPEDIEEFSGYLKELRSNREKEKKAIKSVGNKRQALSPAERETVLKKTGGKCHVCGGSIEDYWEADHVMAASGGGTSLADNFLPAHRICNNYRWDYLPGEFQEILRLGVWLRTEIEKQTAVGKAAGEAFIKKEKVRISRRV